MNNANDLNKKVLEWVMGQGYPLEMKVATSFRNRGFEVIQSHYYPDPENNELREIDIVAITPEYTGLIDVSFVIECKSSKKKPWVLFTSEHTLEGLNIFFSYCINSDSAREILIEKQMETDVKLPWMKKSGRIAYGLTQAFTTGSDITFKASTSVLKAAISRKRILGEKGYSPFVFVFPVIVVDGKIFECFIDKHGELSIQQFHHGFYYFPFDVVGEFGTCIQILTVNGIDDLTEQAKNVSDALLSLLKKDVEKKLKTILKE